MPTWWPRKGRSRPRWNVTGWPTIYILDEEGVIRFVGKRGGEFIAALDELYMEKIMREYESSGPVGMTPAAETETETEDAGDENDYRRRIRSRKELTRRRTPRGPPRDGSLFGL